jgi:membrane-associated phospholipid phosphatase
MARTLTAAMLVLVALPGVSRAQDKVTDPAPSPSGFKSFMGDVGRDYRNFLTLDNAQWAAVGGITTGVFAGVDDELADAAAAPTPTALKPGQTYGNLAFQFPLAVTWWIAGHASGSRRGAAAGRDLLRAQISAVSWTYAIKYSVNRTRPNGDPRSFPSGHTSATFATAMVLQKHYGWKLGLPMFTAATYTAAERVTNNKHWASDVAFGAVIGMLSGRTVTLHLRDAQLGIQPVPVPGGGGVVVHVLR